MTVMDPATTDQVWTARRAPGVLLIHAWMRGGPLLPLSEHDQRILAALDADLSGTRLARILARVRSRCSSLQLNLATVALSALGNGLLAVGVVLDSRPLTLATVFLLAAAPTPTVIAFRYADLGAPSAR